MSLRDTILNADDLVRETVDVPEWGVKVGIRSLTARERGVMVDQVKDRKHMYADMLIAVAFDPDTGEQLFTKADRDALSEKNGQVMDRLATKTIELSGVDIDAAEEDVETDPT